MGLNPASVPPMAGVDIEWVHGSLGKSVGAAKEMVSAYKVVKEPSLTSNHISGLAIDMTLTDYVTKEVKLANGTMQKIASFEDLITVGKTYKVFHKVPHDLPHWSITGL